MGSVYKIGIKNKYFYLLQKISISAPGVPVRQCYYSTAKLNGNVVGGGKLNFGFIMDSINPFNPVSEKVPEEYLE